MPRCHRRRSAGVGSVKREAIQRRPISPGHYGYEQAKRQWIAAHPEATPQQYQDAMARIAKACGV